jgi:serine protease
MVTQSHAIGLLLKERDTMSSSGLQINLMRPYILCGLFLILGSISQLDASSVYTVPGRILVKFKTPPQTSGALLSTGFKSVDDKIKRAGIHHMEKALPGLSESESTLHNIFDFTFDPSIDTEEMIKLFKTDPHVEYAEPKYLHELYAIPNDPYFAASQAYLSNINLPSAWDIVKGDSGNIVIALIDDGVDLDHADLLANLWVNPGEIANNGIDDDQNGYIDDIHGWNFANNTNNPTGVVGSDGYNGHGTRVASLFATTNNSNMLAGASWNCDLMVLNAAFLNVNFGSPSIQWGYESMVYAAENGADIISCSWGRRGGYSQAEADITAYVQSLGVIIFNASGNVNTNADFNPNYPGGYYNVVTVGSTGATNPIRSGFSSYGASVDIFAPGENIKLLSDNGSLSGGTGSGTSFATPIAASIAALIWTLHPDWTADMVREQLRTTSIPMDAANPSYSGKLGHGRVDALAALTAEPGPSVRISDYSVTNSLGTSEILAGDTLMLSIELTNYLNPVENLSLDFTASFPALHVLDGTISVSALAHNESAIVDLHVLIDEGTAPNYVLALYLDLDDGAGYVDRDLMRLYYFPDDHLDVTTGVIQTTIHSNGHIGWRDLQQTVGTGFVYQGQELLPEHGLLIGRSPAQISDNIRNENIIEQDADFRSLTVIETKSNPVYRGDILHSFDDLNGDNPMGLIIEQELLFGSASIPALDRCLSVIYKIHNPTDSTISGIRLGAYTDWDLHSAGLDNIEYDASRKMAIFNNSGESPGLFAGLMLANNDHDIMASIIDNNTSISDGFTDEEKWEFLSMGHNDDLTDANGSAMISVAPFDLVSHHTTTLMYSLIVASSYSDLLTTAGTIQSIYNTAFANEYVGVENDTRQIEHQLVSNFPNPFNPSTTIAYQLPAATEVSLKVYDISGKTIMTLINQTKEAGYYQVNWDGTDQAGQKVAAGMYFARLQTGEQSSVVKMVYLR